MTLKEMHAQVSKLEQLIDFAKIVLTVTKKHEYSEERAQLEDNVYKLIMTAEEKILNLAIQGIHY